MLAKKRAAKRFLLLVGVLLSQVGCVALNIPSQRFHDATDQGGLLGHWRGSSGRPIADNRLIESGTASEFHGSSGICVDGGPLDVDPFDPTLDVDGNPKQPEVPWPRYHPVPTRPVFGTISQ